MSWKCFTLPASSAEALPSGNQQRHGQLLVYPQCDKRSLLYLALVPMHLGKAKLKGKSERKCTKCFRKVENHWSGGIRMLKAIAEGNSKNLEAKVVSLWI